MNFFEQELHKIVAPKYPDATYVGRACYVRLDELNRAKIQFVTGIVANQYHALRVSILNRNEGQVDVLLLNLSDILGKKQTGNPNFRNGINPYIWDDYGKADWYVYHQTARTTSSSRMRCRIIWRCFRSKPKPLTPSGSRPCKELTQGPYQLYGPWPFISSSWCGLTPKRGERTIVYLGFCCRHHPRSDRGLDLRSGHGLSRKLFRRDGQHGRRAVRTELGAEHCTVFLLSGLGALCDRSCGGLF